MWFMKKITTYDFLQELPNGAREIVTTSLTENQIQQWINMIVSGHRSTLRVLIEFPGTHRRPIRSKNLLDDVLSPADVQIAMTRMAPELARIKYGLDDAAVELLYCLAMLQRKWNVFPRNGHQLFAEIRKHKKSGTRLDGFELVMLRTGGNYNKKHFRLRPPMERYRDLVSSGVITGAKDYKCPLSIAMNSRELDEFVQGCPDYFRRISGEQIK